MNKTMTKNEYQEFLKANASRLWNDKSYTMKHYAEDADSVEILEFDLSMYNIPEVIKRWINVYFTEEFISILSKAWFTTTPH